MATRKYLFWKNQEGIRTYKVTRNGTFELQRPSGKDVFVINDWAEFFSWFHKSAGITTDEYIDFCFLSDDNFEVPSLNYNLFSRSSWDIQEIRGFCEEYLHIDTCEIEYEDNKCFVAQNGNVLNKSKVKRMYLKCIPEFKMEIKEKIDNDSKKTSLTSRYYREKLMEL